MNVASLELSKELYELSGWEDLWYIKGEDDAEPWVHERRAAVSGYETLAPAYSIGFLLRKLPVEIGVFDTPDYRGRLTVSPGENNWWYASYDYDKQTVQSAHSPEDAAAKLAIDLFKQGVLTRGGDE